MAKSNTIEAMGTVIDAQPNAMFKVRLDNDFEILAQLSPYDLTRGRITWREK